MSFHPALPRTVLLLLLFVLSVAVLYLAKPILVPFTFATLLAMLFLPLCQWLESKRIGRGFSSLVSVVCFVSIFAGILGFLIWQLTSVGTDLSSIESNLEKIVEKLEATLQQTFGVSKEKQEAFIKQQQQQGQSGVAGYITSFLSSLSGFLLDTVLTLVYMFLVLYFRAHLRKFILQIVPQRKHETANKIIIDSSKVARKYITGLSMMIGILWVMYGIGFSIIGVKNPIFFAILCGILEIVPFVGNLTGTLLTIAGSAAQGGGNIIVGILVTYGVVQFVQTYLLEPLVVGNEENINPLFTILVIVIGEAIWGIPGMVLALPLIGILKVVFDNIEPLQPYGFLLGKPKKSS